MRTVAYLALAAMVLAGCANGGWSGADSYRQAAVIGTGAIDWLQTREIAKHPDQYYETNPILGRHPSTEEVDVYFGACALVHTGVAMALPPAWREPWQYLAIGVEVTAAAHNYDLGIRIPF